VQEDMRNGQIALEKYIITKSLTKPPEAYPDARSQPHVEVALRLRKLGYTSGCSAGDTVPYIICCEQGKGSSTSAGIAQRARHPDELKKDNENLMIDIDYYLAQQIHPVVSRLCASIEGTSPSMLADCLGLDPSKFQSKSSEVANNDHSGSVLGVTDDEERYRGSLKTSTDVQDQSPNTSFWNKLCWRKCQVEVPSVSVANQCDDETCDYTTLSLNLRVIGDSERGTACPNYPRCNGRLVRQYSELNVHKQLSYFCYLLDANRFIDKRGSPNPDSVLKDMFPRLYSLENCKDCYVADKILSSVTTSFRRPVRGGPEAQQLSWVWDMNGDGVFRVKDVRNLLDDTLLPKDEFPTRWVKCVPIKINVFAWKIFLDCLPTRLNLYRRGIVITSVECTIVFAVGGIWIDLLSVLIPTGSSGSKLFEWVQKRKTFWKGSFTLLGGAFGVTEITIVLRLEASERFYF
ncbi:DNA polymerase alpha catalytic subunit, partial [Tanacetum coccineum]